MDSKTKQVFGNAWWILSSESGKFALIKTQINVGDKSLYDLTDEQRKEAEIEIFDTRDKAEAARLDKVMNEIKNA